MRISRFGSLVVASCGLADTAFAFQPARPAVVSSLSWSSTVVLASSKEEENFSLSPETSFGADAVPEGQRPVNEFLEVTSQPMFNWASQEAGNKGLLTRLAIVYSVFFAAVCYPIAGATFTQEGFLLQKLASSNVGALLVIFFVLVRLYSGWSYVGTRLTSTIIEYEESGWYDGDFETKSPSEQLRDELLYEEKVEPVVSRLKLFTLGAGALWLASCVGYKASLSVKPVFDEYNANMLERLRYDEKLAGVAAQQSNGRPTYCESRYYRAVANGGQGCN